MKVLDVSYIEAGIDRAIKDINSFYDQISPIQRSVRDFSTLDGALNGKSGKAIRSFFNEVHQPFLIYLYQSMVDYQEVLEQIKDATKSFESDSEGFIRQDFLEHDVMEGLNNVQREAEGLTDEANAIIGRVSDLVSVDRIEASNVTDHVREGTSKLDRIVEELHILDTYETSLLEQTKNDLRMMKTYLSDMESKLKGGDLSVANFDINDIKGMDAYHSIIDGVYNRGGKGEGEISEMTFEHLPLSVIKQYKDVKLGNLTDDQKNLLNDAFKQLENGEIDRAEYLALYLDIPKLDDSEEVPQSIIDFVYKNKGDLGYTLSADTITQIINQTTHDPKKAATILTKLVGTRANPTTIQDFLTRHGSKLRGGASFLGPFGAALGVHYDIDNHGKTMGEAIVKNLTGAGVGGSVIVTYAAFFGTPVGWAAAIPIGASLVTYGLFNAAYERNTFGLQTGLDYIGGFVQKGIDVLDDWFEVIGESIQYNLDNHQYYNWYN